MSYLLDTHAFIFSVFGIPQLSKRAGELILDEENQIFISIVTFWEIALKYSLGKLDLQGVLPDDMPAVCIQMGFSIIELSSKDAASSYRLKKIFHKDPFDRMLIWQAINNNLSLISKDTAFNNYADLGLNVVW